MVTSLTSVPTGRGWTAGPRGWTVTTQDWTGTDRTMACYPPRAINIQTARGQSIVLTPESISRPGIIFPRTAYHSPSGPYLQTGWTTPLRTLIFTRLLIILIEKAGKWSSERLGRNLSDISFQISVRLYRFRRGHLGHGCRTFTATQSW